MGSQFPQRKTKFVGCFDWVLLIQKVKAYQFQILRLNTLDTVDNVGRKKDLQAYRFGTRRFPNNQKASIAKVI